MENNNSKPCLGHGVLIIYLELYFAFEIQFIDEIDVSDSMIRMKKLRQVEKYTENVQLWHITLTTISCKFFISLFCETGFRNGKFYLCYWVAFETLKPERSFYDTKQYTIIV